MKDASKMPHVSGFDTCLFLIVFATAPPTDAVSSAPTGGMALAAESHPPTGLAQLLSSAPPTDNTPSATIGHIVKRACIFISYLPLTAGKCAGLKFTGDEISMKTLSLLLLGATLQLVSVATTYAQTSGAQPYAASSAIQAAPAQNVQVTSTADRQPKPKKIGIVIFEGFETLDVFGPVQMWGRLPDYEVVMVSEHGGPVRSSQGIETIARYSFENAPQFDILMIPGGGGTRREVNNLVMLDFLREQDKGTQWTTSVCTGSAVLAKAGILNGHKATSNKRAFEFAINQEANVDWQGNARWVIDGKYATSSGVSAGTDMALGLVESIYGRAIAKGIANGAEYEWNGDAGNDPFARVQGACFFEKCFASFDDQ